MAAWEPECRLEETQKHGIPENTGLWPRKVTRKAEPWARGQPEFLDAKANGTPANKEDHLERSSSQDGQSFLIVVRMTVTPTPVLPLSSGVLPVVGTIGPVLRHVITPVGAIFAVVPVVVVTAIPIVDPDLHAGFLRLWASHAYRWCGKGSAQKQQAEVSIDMKQDMFLPFRGIQIQIPGKVDNALLSAR